MKLIPGGFISEFSLGADGEPPSEFRIFRNGTNRSTKGTFHFTDASAKTCMSEFAQCGVDLMVDYEHAAWAAKYAVDPAQAGKAAGWFKPAVKDGELWATRCSWTPEGAAKLKAREFRYMSPLFGHTEDGTVMSLMNVALTNMPALFEVTPLMASAFSKLFPDTPEFTKMKTLLAMLSLPEAATEAQAVEAFQKFKDGTESVLKLCGASTVSEALGKIQGWQKGAESAAALSKRLEDQEHAEKSAKLKAMLEKAVADKKIAPSEVEHLSKTSDVEWLAGYIKAKPAVIGAPAVAPKPGEAGTAQANTAGVTEADKHVAKMLSRSPADYAKRLEDLAKHKESLGPITRSLVNAAAED